MVVVCACVAGGCRGPLFVLGPFVLAGDGSCGGAFIDGCFSRGFFHLWERSCVLFSFGLVGSEEGTFYFWITARLHAIGVVCGGCLFCFCQVFGPFIVFVILLI